MTSESRQPAVQTDPADGEPRPLAYASPELADTPELPPRERLRRRFVVALAMGLGSWVAGWSGQTWGDGMDYALMAVLPVALIPPLRRRFVAALDRVRHPSPRARSLIAAIVGILAALLAYGQALRIGRELTPHWHDEHSYLLQAVHLSQFKLWVTPPPGWPLADFFESFHIFTAPVYCSVYCTG